MNSSIILCCVSLLVVNVLCHILPRFTRPDLFFGVTVDPAFRHTDAAQRIIYSYRLVIWCSTIAAGGIVLSLQRPIAAWIIYAAGVFGAQLTSHHRSLVHAGRRPSVVEIDVAAPSEHLPGGLVIAALPFVALAGLGFWAVPHVNQLPLRLPVHWGFGGPDRWVTTSPRAIITLLLQHAFICLTLIATALGVLHWSRRISTSGPSAVAERQFRQRAVLLILTAEYFTILPPAFSLLQAPPFAMRLWSVALPITLLAFILSLMRSGQGGTRASTAPPRLIGDRTDDDRWIGGIIYFGRTDPALLVEKRMGVGWTLNFGNPWSWVLLIAIFMVPPIIQHVLR